MYRKNKHKKQKNKKTKKETAFFCVLKKLKWISAMTGKQTNKNNYHIQSQNGYHPKHGCSYLCEEGKICERTACLNDHGAQ